MSAATLRKFGRGSAIIATTALVMTSFGPAAMAWNPPAVAGTGSDTANVGSLGVIDADTSTPGTQGAQSVQAGANGQDMADLRMVLPATWQAGDHIDLQLGWTVNGTTFIPNNTGDAENRLQWSSAPTVNVDTKAYDVPTRVHSTSTMLNDPAVDDATEQHTEDAWVNPNPNTVANPVAPTFAAPQLVTGQNGTDVVRLTFSNTADSSASSAKYIMSVNGPKVDVGDKVTGDIGVQANAFTGAGVATPNTALFQDEDGAAGNTTWPAFISPVSMTVEDGAIASQNVAQTVGPITVTPADGVFAGGPVSVAIQDARGNDSPIDFVEGRYTATIYNVAGKVLETQNLDMTNGGTLTAAVPANAARVVFSGMLARDTASSPNGPSKAYQYALTRAGGETTIDGPLGSGVSGTNQNDIQRDDMLRVASQTTSVMGTRIGGANRYETAVRIADNRTTYNGTIVLASGERWPDAMSSGYLAHSKDAPILLTQNGVLPQPVMEFMKRRGVQRIYIVGGDGVVSKKVENQLREMGQLYPIPAQITTPYGTIVNPQPDGSVASTAKMNVTRLGGSDRYETNLKTNEYASYNSPKRIDTLQTEYGQAAKTSGILVSGQTPWDALAAGPLVAGPKGNGLPIILTTGTTLAPDAGRQIQALDITQLVMVGGTGVLSDSLKSESNKFGVTASLRVAGSDRYGTSKAVGEMLLNPATRDMPANYGWGGTTQRVALVANGGQPFANAFADALAAGPLAISQKSPVVLTARDALPTPSRQFLDEKSAVLSSATALGQGGAVSLAVLNAANALVAD